jgi:Signal transduction histidine kinase
VDTLNDAYNKVSDVIEHSNNKNGLTENEQKKIERFESDFDVDIYVLNSLNASKNNKKNLSENTVDVLFPAIDNIGKRELLEMNDIFLEYSGFTNPNIEDKKLLSEKNNYFIIRLHDRQMNSNYMDLFGVINGDSDDSRNIDHTIKMADNSYFIKGSIEDMRILIRSNVESIKEGVAIANEFLAYVGILAVIVGTLAMFLISKRFTKPILELAGIAKKMTALNFDVRYKIETEDEIGELGSSINILSDKLESTITELKQANNELLTDIQRKTEIDEMRKEFLSNVSHELKTPISLIQGYAEGLKENINDDEESRDFYCEVIIDEADKMNKMVKKLLSLNEIEFGNNQVNFERFDIVALIRSVIDTSEILIRQKEATLIFEQTEPAYVWADEFLIQQVVTNYISNALNHVSGQKIIEVKLIPRGDTLRIAVFNTGENIPEEELDKIWIKFYKVDKARTREYGGSGIGLSIVKAILNSHNKECGVINRPIGVEFWFELDIKS